MVKCLTLNKEVQKKFPDASVLSSDYINKAILAYTDLLEGKFDYNGDGLAFIGGSVYFPEWLKSKPDFNALFKQRSNG